MNLICASVPMFFVLSDASAQKEVQQRPNIIHIMTDDHSYQAISAYGHPLSVQAPTPNLDRLASEGMLFRQAFVENSLSTPSRACLMTGLYSHQSGQRRLDAGIDTAHVFVSEILKENGYETGVVGKWHMRCEPKGFDYYHILWDQGEYYNPGFRSKKTNGKYVKEKGYVTNLITDHAIEFLEERDRNKPFCLFVHHKAPHRNWMPDTKYVDLYEEVEFPYPATFKDDYATRGEAARKQQMSISKDLSLAYDLKVRELGDRPGLKDDWSIRSMEGSLNRMDSADRKKWLEAYEPRNRKFIEQNLQGDELLKWKYQRYIRDYMRCIKSVDEEVGRLLAYLEKEGLMDNTIIVYTSDQGFYMGEHGWFDKRFMYEESFRTPLIIRYPTRIKAGTVSDALVQNIDYAPTFLDMAGIDKPDFMVGTSLAPLFKNKGKAPSGWRKYLYYHYYDYPAVHNVRRHDGIRDSRYKLIHFYGNGINYNELYDLKEDSNELHNLYGNPKYDKVAARLQKELDKIRTEQKVDEF